MTRVGPLSCEAPSLPSEDRRAVRDEEHQLSFTDYLRRAFEGKGFLRADRQEERPNHDLTRDQLASVTDWLASVEYERLDF